MKIFKGSAIFVLGVVVMIAAFFGATAHALMDDSWDWGGYWYEPYEPQPYEQGYYQGGYYDQGNYYAEGGYYSEGGYGGGGYSQSSYQSSYEANYWQPSRYDDMYGDYQGYYQGYYEGAYQSSYQASYDQPIVEDVNGDGFQCNRRGHNDSKTCEPQTYEIPPGADSITFNLEGQRYGGSQVTATICVTPHGGEPICEGFHGTGSTLGQERGKPGTPYCYLCGTIPLNGSGATVSIQVFVKDSTTNFQLSTTRPPSNQPNVDNAPAGYAVCENNSCTWKEGNGASTCSSDAQCISGTPPNPQSGHFACTRCGACSWVSGSGPDSCSRGTDCDCQGPGPTQAGYEGGYEGAYESGYQGGYEATYQGAYEAGYEATYQGAYQVYYQANYQGGYPSSRRVCTSNGACVSVSGAGSNECSTAVDCDQPVATCTMTAVPSRVIIPPPQSITLTWSCQPTNIPTNCTITNVGTVAPSGSLVVNPTSSVNYTLTCTNAAGTGEATVRARVFSGEPGSLKEVNPGGQ